MQSNVNENRHFTYYMGNYYRYFSASLETKKRKKKLYFNYLYSFGIKPNGETFSQKYTASYYKAISENGKSFMYLLKSQENIIDMD